VERGGRPEWSRDGKKIAYIDRDFGNVYELELLTGTIRCITCDFQHQGFLRVHILKDGDYLLLGPRHFNGNFTSRFYGNGFWWMPADRLSPPVWLGEEHFEGVAVSRESRLIAYSKTWYDRPFIIPSRIYVAEITKSGKLIGKRAVYTTMDLIEPQDFLPGDRGISFTRYFSLFNPNYDVMTLDFASGAVVNHTNSPASEEVEGIFPDGRFTLVESDRHSGLPGDMDIDIYMLRLDGAGEMRRLTHFNDNPAEKACNPVVSPDGCSIAFMKGTRSTDWRKVTGDSDGIYLLEFYSCGD
jgi:Tol biopolymer transport system component